MAIWQFNIYFIPRASLVVTYGQIPKQLEIENALEIEWWSNINVGLNSLFPMLEQFGEVQKWSANIDGLRSFGDVDSNDITVCFSKESNLVQELSCRIDVRQINKEFINKCLSLAKEFDCLLLDRQGKLFQPLHTTLVDRIKLSNSNRFVQDSDLFFEDLSDGFVTPQ